MTESTKESNPKDAIGVGKSPLSKIPMQVVYEAGLGMLEGACKYGAFNYRAAGVRASVYYDALQRHMNAWWEGEDTDPDSGLSHVTKAITTLMVLRDAMLQDKLTDDRPPSALNSNWMQEYNQKAADIISKYKDKNPKHYTIADTETKEVFLFSHPTEVQTIRLENFRDTTLSSSGAESGTIQVGQQFPHLLRRKSDYPVEL